MTDPLLPHLLDLLSRLPRRDEAVPVRGVRVGAGADAGVHGRKVPEAFAVDCGRREGVDIPRRFV